MPAIARSEPFRGQGPCPLGVCDGSGWILDEDDVANECDCRAQRLKKGRGRGVASVIPAKFRGVSFDRPPVSTEINPIAVGITREFVERLDKHLEKGQGLWLMGSTGTGKTTLSMLISSHALAQGYSVAIYTMPKLLARIRATYERDKGDDTYLQFFERLSQVDLLHIDDFGAEKRSEWVIEQLYSILNERYEQERSIIVTTNLDFADKQVRQPGVYGREPDTQSWLHRLEDEVGPRTVSRLIEVCGDPVPMFGEDARVQVRVADQ